MGQICESKRTDRVEAAAWLPILVFALTLGLDFGVLGPVFGPALEGLGPSLETLARSAFSEAVVEAVVAFLRQCSRK